MSYNKEIDYQSKIDEAVSRGDYKNAALYEKSRNEKIDAEGLDYKKTNRFSGWLNTKDYGTEIQNQIKSGASKSAVAETLKKREKKASGTEGLSQYAYDDIYDKAVDYIMNSDFSYNKERKEYKDKYEDKIQKLYNELLNMDKFSYNPFTSESYKYYRDAYRREGDRAMEETLGALATNTGGVASSYAVTAAQQAQDYYNSKLADKIPELYEQEYKRYRDKISDKLENIELLQSLSEEDYSRYLDEAQQYEDDRSFAYKKYVDDRSYEQKQREIERKNYESDKDFEMSLQKLAAEAEENSRKWSQKDYENSQNEENQKREEALKKWSTLGYLDSESAEILGLPQGLETSDYRYKQAQLRK